MCEEFNKSLLKMSVAQICLSMGWHSMQKSTHAILTDILERYVRKLSKTVVNYSENYCRTVPTLDDIGLAFNDIGIPLDELKDYVAQVEAVPFPKPIGSFPKERSTGVIATTPSQEELTSRPDYYDDNLPALSSVAVSADDHANEEMQSPDPQAVTASISQSTPMPLKLPLARKRSATSPPYSPVEPKRLNLDAEHYSSDLTRPDLKVSTPKGLAPISTVGEPTNVVSTKTVSHADRQHPKAASEVMRSPERPSPKPDRTKPTSGLLSPPAAKESRKSPDRKPVVSPTTTAAGVSPKSGSKKSNKDHLALDLPGIVPTPSKVSPKPKKAKVKTASSAKKKLASPMKSTPKKSPVTPTVIVHSELAVKQEQVKAVSPSKSKKQLSGGPASSPAAQLPVSPVKSAAVSTPPCLGSPPEIKKQTTKQPDLLSPIDNPKKHATEKPSAKAKKKKTAKTVPSLSISNVLFSDPLPTASVTLKRPSPNEPTDPTKTHGLFKSPSPVKSPAVKTSHDPAALKSSSTKKKKKKAKDKDKDRDEKSKASSEKSGSQSEKKVKKEKTTSSSSDKTVPKLTLKMDLQRSEGDVGVSPKLIIKTGSSSNSKQAKAAQPPAVVQRAPMLPTTVKAEKTDDKSRSVFTETLTTTLNQAGSDLYYCPTCTLPDNGSPMIGCDTCDQWFHWPCVSVFVAPKDDESWFCPSCRQKQAKKKKKKRKDD